jgi:hypothetical protein
MIRRTLDDLYWGMSYSRWKDPQFWPMFRDAFLKTHPQLTLAGMEASPTSTDAGVYGFIANIYYYNIETPLRAFVASQPNLVRHCKAIHAAVSAVT